jgi:hypothetical protein
MADSFAAKNPDMGQEEIQRKSFRDGRAYLDPFSCHSTPIAPLSPGLAFFDSFIPRRKFMRIFMQSTS